MAAKSAFEKGIALMRKRIATLEQSGTSHEDEKLSVEKEKEIGDLKYEISSAFVSIAELFMTDLCDEDDAETECEKYLNLSLAADPTNSETYAAFGQFRHCQLKDDDAVMYFGIALKKLFGAMKMEADEKLEKKLDIFSDRSLTIDSFLKIIKLGIELEQYDLCVRVLKGMIKFDDGIGESWALGALVFYKLDRKEECAIWLANAEAVW